MNLMSNFATAMRRRLLTLLFVMLGSALGAPAVLAQPREGGEAALKLPDLSSVTFLGIDGHKLLLVGLVFCFLGLMFGLAIYIQLKNLPVHRSMREISELIYETCKTYLTTQGKFIMILWVFIAVIVVAYFGVLRPVPGKSGGAHRADDFVFQSDRHRRELRRGVVWNSRQHVCEFAHRVREFGRQALSNLRDSA